MSAVDTTLLFHLRASRDLLPADLRAGEQEILTSVKRSADRITQQVKSQPIQFEIKFNEADARAQAQRYIDIVKSEVDKNKISLEASKLGGDKAFAQENRERFRGTARTDDIGPSGDALKQAVELERTVSRIARVATLISAAFAAVEVALAAEELVAAAVSGEYERQVKAAQAAEDAVKGLPFVGEKILAIGKKINKYTIDLVTHEQDYVKTIQEATAEQDKHTAALAKRAGVRKTDIDTATTVSKAVGTEENPRLTQEQQTNAKIAKERKALAEVLSSPSLHDKTGGLSQTGLAIQKEGLARIANEQAKVDQDAAERHSQMVAKTSSEELKSQNMVAEAERADLVETLRQRLAAAEKVSQHEVTQQGILNQFILRNYDEQAARKKETTLAGLRDTEATGLAKIVGRDTFDVEQSTLRRQYDDKIKLEADAQIKSQLIRTRDTDLAAREMDHRKQITADEAATESKIREDALRAAGNTYEADKVAFEAAADAKINAAKTFADRQNAIREKAAGEAAMKTQEQRKIEDMQEETKGLALRRKGRGDEADVLDIMKRARDEIKAAEGDSQLQAAIAARASEQVRAVKPDTQTAEVTSSANASRLNLFGGSPRADRLTTIQEEALAVLKTIRDRSTTSTTS